MVRPLLLGILALIVGVAPALATTYIVDRDDESPTATACADADAKDCSLRGAILAANAHAGPDMILVPGGTYTLTLDGDETTVGDAGDLDVTETVTIQGSDTVIQGCEPVAPATDCVGLDRILHLHGGQPAVVLTMSGVTIKRGTTKGDGGGILVDAGATLKLTNAKVQENAADGAGGGIAVLAGGSATLTSLVVSNNTSGESGGGIFLGARGADPASGGTVQLIQSSVQDNVAGGGGGGIARLNGALAVAASTIAGNRSGSGLDDALAGSGGGVFVGMGDDVASTIAESTISGNVGHVAGGVAALGALTVRGVTVTANEMHSGGNGAGGVASVGSLRILNTIVAGNSADTGQPADCLGTLQSGGYNLVGDGDSCAGLANGTGGDQVGTATAPIDPRLGPLVLHGSTRSHALLPGSPAIDAGNPASPNGGGDACSAVDQGGTPRGITQTGRCDIGAFELFGSGTTTTTVESTTTTTESSTSTTESTSTTQVTSTTLVVPTTSTTTSTVTTSTEPTTSTTETSTSTSSSSTSTSITESTTTSTSISETTTSTSSTSSSSSSTTSTSSTTLPPPIEICDNCIDDDGNGLTDFEDPACCAQLQLAAMSIQKTTLSVAKGNTTLKLTASLVQSGLSAGTASDQDVHLQLRRVGEPDVLCARIPAASLTRKKNTLHFRDKKHVLASAVGVDSLVLKGKKNGGGSLTVGSSRLAINLPAAGDVQITLGLRDPGAAETGNRCTTAQIALKAGKKGGLKFP